MVTAVVLNTGEAGREVLMVTAVVLNTGEAGHEALMVTAVLLNTISCTNKSMYKTCKHAPENGMKIVCDDMPCTRPSVDS